MHYWPEGGWVAEVGVNVGAVGDKVDSMGGVVTGEPGMNVGAFGGKLNGCAASWRLAAGIKVVAVGDSVESMGVEAASGADKGVDCMGCARIGSVAVDGEQGVAGGPPSV